MKQFIIAILTTFSMACGIASADGFPEKPVSLVVPYPAGGNVDSAARIISPVMESLLGQPFVVENRPGANGMIAAEHVLQSDADGYTLFVAANSPLLFSPITFGRPDAYNWKTDFEPIGPVSMTPMVLIARADLGVSTANELIEAITQNNLLMASSSAGSTNHLAAVLLQESVGQDWKIVQYKGNADGIASILGGETQFSFEQISVALPHINDGNLVPIAVTSAERLSVLPDVPTITETGIAKFQAVTFTGLLAPTGTPEATIDILSDALVKTMSTPEVSDKFAKLGSNAAVMTPSEFNDFLVEIDDTWKPVVVKVNDAKKN